MTFYSFILAFGFVTPLFAAAGLGLISIPILIHIFNRRRYKIVSWAAMDFLLNAMKKNRRRLKFEQWLLLAVRCLVLALLGLALARPMGCENTTIGKFGSRAGVHVLVIDNSYSMGYEVDRANAHTHLAQAKILAKGMIDRLSRGGESVAIITASWPATAIGNGKPTYDLDAAKAAVDRIELSAGGTDIEGALQLALKVGQDEIKQPAHALYLLTDCTKSAWETSQASAIKQTAGELAKIFTITNFNLASGTQSNDAVIDLSSAGNLVTTKFPAEFRAIVRGYGNPTDAPLQWKIDDQLQPGGGTVKLDTQTLPQTLANVPIKVGGPHIISASLAGGDKLKVDDSRWLVSMVASELKVLVVEGERAMGGSGGSGSYLQLALSPPSSGEHGSNGGNFKTDSYVNAESISALELGNKVLTDYAAVAMTDVGQITASQADRLAEYVKSGGTVMWFMGDQVNSDNYNQMLVPRKLLPGTLTKRMSVASDQQAFLFDFKPHAPLHRLLSIFANEDRTGLSTAQIFTYWQVAISPDSQAERVLDYLPAGSAPDSKADKSVTADPAITTQSLGRGRVVFFSTTADSNWTSFPAKPAYVTLMHELLSGSVSSGDRWLNRTVGQIVEVPASLQITEQPTLLDPNQKPIVLTPATVASATAYTSQELTKPGIYTLNTGNRTFPIAVNVPSDEADVRTMDNVAIKSALGGIDVNLQLDQLPPEAVVQQTGNDFGWIAMVIVLILVGAECFLAMQFGHTRRAVVKAAA